MDWSDSGRARRETCRKRERRRAIAQSVPVSMTCSATAHGAILPYVAAPPETMSTGRRNPGTERAGSGIDSPPDLTALHDLPFSRIERACIAASRGGSNSRLEPSYQALHRSRCARCRSAVGKAIGGSEHRIRDGNGYLHTQDLTARFRRTFFGTRWHRSACRISSCTCAPEVRCLVKMRDCNDNNLLVRRLVNQSIRESVHLAASDCSSEGMPSQRKAPDALDCFPCLITEFIAQAHALSIVVTNRLMQLMTGGEQEPCPQTRLPSSAKTSSASRPASSPEWYASSRSSASLSH